MSPEQILLIAREFCARYGTTVTDFAALVAGASASAAKVEGIPVHADARQAAAALRRVLIAVPALGAYNKEFADYCAQVFLHVAATR
ncbi:cell filamentation protein Fic [Corynebacterium phoceense]|uniref:cell filamentation protein Fic n=1 Tax=Corynebacterium phoceense TaxID=1686286 RepID=UPI00211BB762|nr:cell filamentation protein Fic [Corynebacterium phoceense]MCQ9331380.1 cell filamentation protein Fic [Corynebacterium phoceense]MCQ9348273.1 cell filamentation protein Fic [Corynebacterium phoceense]